MDNCERTTLFQCNLCQFVCTDDFHSLLHQKFSHSGVDSSRLKKLLFDFVSSFVDSHQYYQNLNSGESSSNDATPPPPAPPPPSTSPTSLRKRKHDSNSPRKRKPSTIFRPNDANVITPKTLESIQNHLNRNCPTPPPHDFQQEEPSEVTDLDCEVEILSTENEESDAPPELESVNGDDEQPDNVLDHLLDGEEEDEPLLQRQVSPPTPPPPLSLSPTNEATDVQLVAPVQPTTPPKEPPLPKRKKRYSEDIPNSLKEPEKRISRSGRQCRGVIPFSIDNPRHYSVKKLKNRNQKAKKVVINGNHSRDSAALSAEIEEIELDSLAEKTHEELLTTIKSENANSPSLSANWNCQVCGEKFDSEYKLFNHVDNATGKRIKCAPHQAQKRWKERIRGAIDEIESGGGYGHYSFEMQTQSSKTKFSPVWRVFSKIRFKGELLPFVFHHEKECGHVVHWSGSTSCLKRHIKTCPHLGNGTSERFADLRQEFDKNWLLELANLDDTR